MEGLSPDTATPERFTENLIHYYKRLINVALSFHENPKANWNKELQAMQERYQKKFLPFREPPPNEGIVIVVLSHNDSGGDLETCLWAISHLNIPQGFENKVKVIVIGHNNDKTDQAPQLCDDLGISYIPYNTELKGASYPMQIIPHLPEMKNAKYLCLIDGDTFVPPNWLVDHLNNFKKNPKLAASVGPRLYISIKKDSVEAAPKEEGVKKGRLSFPPYGVIKVAAEQSLPFLRKLVAGAGFFDMYQYSLVVENNLGKMLIDGDFQIEFGRNVDKIRSVAISRDDKFAGIPLWELPLFLWKKFRSVTSTEQLPLDSHLRFITKELPRYFPGFNEMLASQPEIQSRINDWQTGELPPNEKKNLLETLMEIKNKFEDECFQIINQDINNMTSSFSWEDTKGIGNKHGVYTRSVRGRR